MSRRRQEVDGLFVSFALICTVILCGLLTAAVIDWQDHTLLTLFGGAQ